MRLALLTLILTEILFAAPNHHFNVKELSDAAKDAYRTRNWDSFFGRAGFLRQLAPDSRARNEILILEAVGLLRRCQWQRAGSLRRELGQSAHLAAFREELATIDGILRYFTQVMLPEEAQATPLVAKANSEKKGSLWKLSADMALRVNPFQLKRRVKNKCGEVTE